jgi:hypothetical protein
MADREIREGSDEEEDSWQRHDGDVALVTSTLAGRGSGSRHGKGAEDSSELEGSNPSLNDADPHFGRDRHGFAHARDDAGGGASPGPLLPERRLGLSER